MNVTTYTLSNETRDALSTAAQPFLHYGQEVQHKAQIGGESPVPAPVSDEIAREMADAFASILANDTQGAKALRTMQQLRDNSGPPACVLSNLPTGEKEAQAVIEMHRHFMQQGNRPKQPEYPSQVTLQDHLISDFANNTPLKSEGVRYPHSDVSHYAALFCKAAGPNPRPTILYSPEDWVETIIDHMDNPPQIAGERQALAHTIASTMTQHFWNAPQGAATPSVRDYHERINQTEIPSLQPPVSLLYPNPDYDPSTPGSSPLSFNRPRLNEKKYTLDPAHETPFNVALTKAWMAALKSNAYGHGEPVFLQKGEMLLFNNHQLMHAGGDFLHEDMEYIYELPLDEQMTPRQIVASDIEMARIPHHPTPPENRVNPADLVRMGIVLDTPKNVIEM